MPTHAIVRHVATHLTCSATPADARVWASSAARVPERRRPASDEQRPRNASDGNAEPVQARCVRPVVVLGHSLIPTDVLGLRHRRWLRHSALTRHTCFEARAAASVSPTSRPWRSDSRKSCLSRLLPKVADPRSRAPPRMHLAGVESMSSPFSESSEAGFPRWQRHGHLRARERERRVCDFAAVVRRFRVSGGCCPVLRADEAPRNNDDPPY